MVKLKRKEGKLTAADLAGYGILPEQPDESKPVKTQESETLDGAKPLPIGEKSQLHTLTLPRAKTVAGDFECKRLP